MLVSVIIPSYRGEHKLPHIIRSLQVQTYSHFEIIVVVDREADDSAAILPQLPIRQPLKVVEYVNRGRAATRNTGAAEAKGELLIFLDDDTRPEPDCVEKHIEHHRRIAKSILVGNVPEDYGVMRSDFQLYKAHLSRKWVTPLETLQGPLSEEKLFLTAANFSIPASLFRQLGGFDERLTDAEDFDLAVRAYQANIPLYFNAQAVAWHDDFITCQSYVKRLRQYKQAHLKLRQLKPALYEKFNQYEYNSISGLKRQVYSLVSTQWMVSAIDKELLYPLPKKLRYKLYDVITTGLAIYFSERPL